MDGTAVWITGLPGSGKSTLADALKKIRGDFIILRMDELRKIVTPEPAYSESERDMVYRSLVYLSKKLSETGQNVIIDATGNIRKWRELARSLVPRYIEVYLKCPVEECMRRERSRRDRRGAPKDIYLKGEAGWPVPGVNAPYEEPLSPEIVIECSTPVREAVAVIIDFLGKIPAS
jgi:adenylylsulfate kinase